MLESLKFRSEDETAQSFAHQIMSGSKEKENNTLQDFIGEINRHPAQKSFNKQMLADIDIDNDYVPSQDQVIAPPRNAKLCLPPVFNLRNLTGVSGRTDNEQECSTKFQEIIDSSTEITPDGEAQRLPDPNPAPRREERRISDQWFHL